MRRISKQLHVTAWTLLLTSCATVSTVHKMAAVAVSVRPLQSSAGRPIDGMRVGAATVLGAYHLSSDDPRFGGFSGIALTADGTRLALVSDRGAWATARLHYGRDRRLISLSGWRMGGLRNPAGGFVQGKMGDAEGLARDARGDWLVSFEQAHRIWRYPADWRLPATEPALLALPEGLRRSAPPNGGVETLEVLASGRVLVVAEETSSTGDERPACIMGGPRPEPKRYVTTGGYVPTDAARLPNGRVVFLERHYDPASRRVRARLRWLWEEELERRDRWEPRFAADLDAPLPVDNFEGIAAMPATEHEDVLLVSDDNFASHQRTLIYQLRLSLPQRSRCRCAGGR